MMIAQTTIRVVSPGGTVRGTLLELHNEAAPVSEFATVLTNRRFPLAWADPGAALTPVVAQQGDLLIVEIGARATNASTGNLGYVIDFGANAAGDLAEDETSTAQLCPWIEFSQDIELIGTTATEARVPAADQKLPLLEPYVVDMGPTERIPALASGRQGVISPVPGVYKMAALTTSGAEVSWPSVGWPDYAGVRYVDEGAGPLRIDTIAISQQPHK